ncbi:MAG: hypothetical protein R2932_42585 [Caldilineaceae bacterium]
MRQRPELHDRNQYWLAAIAGMVANGSRPVAGGCAQRHAQRFYRGACRPGATTTSNAAMRHPQITLLDWVTEVPDETAQGEYLRSILPRPIGWPTRR